MIIAVASYKGGVGKTTTAIHLATYLANFAGSTLLVDGDAIRTATKWAARQGGKGLPFEVIPTAHVARRGRSVSHLVIDTPANCQDEEIRDLASGCDVLVIPAVPETAATDGLTHTLQKMEAFKCSHYKVLLTMVQPPPKTDAAQLREDLNAHSIPIFKTQIPRLTAFEKACAEGVPVYSIKDVRAGRAWDAYLRAGKEICNA